MASFILKSMFQGDGDGPREACPLSLPFCHHLTQPV